VFRAHGALSGVATTAPILAAALNGPTNIQVIYILRKYLQISHRSYLDVLLEHKPKSRGNRQTYERASSREQIP
jgi:hypothetical protein